MRAVRGTVEGAGVELAYEQHGDPGGSPVLLLHDLGRTGASLRPAAERLAAAGARVVVLDRRGYGGSGAPEPYDATTVEEQAEDAAAVLTALGLAPATVGGAGFGALAALDLLQRHPGLVRGAVLADPPAFAFVPEATAVLADGRVRLREAIEAGGPAAGVASWTGTEPSPDAVRGFYADLGGIATLALTRAGLRAIDRPVTLVTGDATPAHVAAAAAALAGLLPRARHRTDGELGAALTDLIAEAS